MQPKQHAPITRACIWFVANRPCLQEWAAAKPTIDGVTYSSKWVTSTEMWVGEWRAMYRMAKQFFRGGEIK